MQTRLFKKPNSPFWFMDLRQYGGGRASTKRTRKADAYLVAEAETKRLLDARQLGLNEEVTLECALERLRATLRGSYKKTVGDSARRLCGDWEGPKLDPEMPMHRLTSAMVSKWKDQRMGHETASKSIPNDMRVLRRVYRLCLLEWGVQVQANVVFSIPQGNTRRRRLNRDEESILLHELNPTRSLKGVPDTGPRRQQMQDTYDLTLILLDTGMRVGEACALRWNDINLQEGTILVYREKTDTESLVGITQRVRQVLTRRRPGSDTSQYVFPAWEAGFVCNPLRPRGGAHSTKAITRAIKRAGINDDAEVVRRYGKFTVHSFRDTFASRLIEGGLSKRGAQDLMGHATSNMVDKYTHLEGKRTAEQQARILSEL